jgi:hypothetical protein
MNHPALPKLDVDRSDRRAGCSSACAVVSWAWDKPRCPSSASHSSSARCYAGIVRYVSLPKFQSWRVGAWRTPSTGGRQIQRRQQLLQAGENAHTLMSSLPGRPCTR